MSNTPRCHTCHHPGRWHRKVTGSKKPCDCQCHTAPTVYRRHTWPAWVDADIDFEVAS